MAIGWFIVPYKREEDDPRPVRYCAIDDQTTIIIASGGMWTESEVLGDRAIVKVRASTPVLSDLDVLYKRLPKDDINQSLSDLSTGGRDSLKSELLDMGYENSEIEVSLGTDVRDNTLGDYLNFAATRRLKPRYDRGTDTIVLDGKIQSCKSIDDVNQRVR